MNELVVEENQINNLLESGISKIRTILDNQFYPVSSIYPDHPILGKDNESKSYLF